MLRMRDERQQESNNKGEKARWVIRRGTIVNVERKQAVAARQEQLELEEEE